MSTPETAASESDPNANALPSPGPEPGPGRPTRFAVVLNANAGTVAGTGAAKISERLLEIFRELGASAEVEIVESRAVNEALRRACEGSADAIVVGGGDGTVNTAATLLAGGSKPLGIIPLGTYNLAARDLGMPMDWEEAARAIATAPVAEMDLIDVSGRLALCVVVLGFYPSLALGRPEYHGRWIVKAWRTARQVFANAATFPPLHLVLSRDSSERHFHTRLALITNNDYEDVFGLLPKRRSLDAGYFTVYISRHRTRWGLFRSLAAWVLGRWKADHELSVLQATRLEIEVPRRRRIAVMRDGETERIAVPFRVELRPRALRVMAPRRLEAESPQAPGD